MGRSPCCAKKGLNKGAWNAEEDRILTECIKTYGEGKWRNLPQRAGLKRCGKSCRLRWLNYLKPDIKRGNISPDEEDLIIRLHKLLGNRWSLIAGRLPGRTDNEIKNYWNSKLAKRSITPSISEPSERSCVNNIEAKNATASLAIRTKARKFSKKLSDLIPPNDDDVLKSTPQSTFNPLITQLDRGNNGEGHDLDVAEDDLGLDLLKFTFDDLQACDDGAKGEITHDLCLDLEYHLADQGETTLNWMEKHLLEDGNTIDSGFLDCLIENEEWLT